MGVDGTLCDIPLQSSVPSMCRVTATEPISIDDLRRLVPGRFRDFVKGVVDLRRGILLLDADMHADQEAALLRPLFGNRSRGIDDEATRAAVAALVDLLVRR
jgi:hypothetical protein